MASISGHVSPQHFRAFTLVEVALALAVMGLIGAISFPLLSHLLNQQKVNRTETRLETARGEVLGFAMRTLALPGNINQIGHQTDAWRSVLKYEPSQDISAPNLCDFLQDDSETELRIALPDLRTITNVAFVLISPGRDRVLDTTIEEDGETTTVTVLQPGEAVNGRKYDDLLVYMTADYLRSRILDRCPEIEEEQASPEG